MTAEDKARGLEMTLFRGVAAVAAVAICCAGITVAAQDEGGPYGTYVSGPIRKLPNGGRPPKKIPFPAIADWSTLKLTLQRTMCFGTCPAYSVEIGADGTVRYEGTNFVAVVGKHQAHIPADRVRALYDAFVKADFFWTFDEYRARITDLPTYQVSISFDGRTKSVFDYAGQAVGMPKEISELENAIDAAAGTKKWVQGDENTFASLEAEHWDFRATDDEHLALIDSAAKRGDVVLVRRLLTAGVSARNKFGCKALEAAATAGNADIVDALLAAGAPIHWQAPPGEDYHTCDVLAGAAASGSPTIMRAVLAARPDINRQDGNGTTALMQATGGTRNKSRQGQEFAAVVRMLIGAGADVNLRDHDGASAISMVRENGDIVRILLAAGAKDVDKPDSHGQTPVMRSYDPEVTQALLDGGADPWRVNGHGENAFQAVSRSFGSDNAAAAVLARWMSTHPKPR